MGFFEKMKKEYYCSMKRKNLYSEIKNSENKILFSNKIVMETNMEVKVTKTYKVGNLEFSSIEAVQQHVAKETVMAYLAEGVDHVIENSAEFIKQLKILSGIKYSNVGSNKGNLKDINEYLERHGSNLVRSALDWPVYTVNTPYESFTIRFTGKVWELHSLIVDSEDWILELRKHRV